MVLTMPDEDKRQTLKLLSLGTIALSGIGAGVAAGNDESSSSSDSSSDDADGQATSGLFSTGLLTGEQQVPPVDSDGQGVALFRPNADGKLEYGLLAFGLEAPVTKAHIHAGESDESGPHVVNLIDGSATDEQSLFGNGVVARGTVSDDDLVGPYEDSSLDDLVSEMSTGGTYVNVHSEAHPDGEVRDQVRLVDSVDIGFETSIDADANDAMEGGEMPSLDVTISKAGCR